MKSFLIDQGGLEGWGSSLLSEWSRSEGWEEGPDRALPRGFWKSLKECAFYWCGDQGKVREKDLGQRLPGDGNGGGTKASDHRQLRRQTPKPV